MSLPKRQLKRSVSTPNKKYNQHKVAKIFHLPIEIQCQVFKTIDVDDLYNVLESNQTLKRNVTSCVENIIIKDDKVDIQKLKKLSLPRLKNIVHRNGGLYKYVNKAIQDEDFSTLEYLLKYGKFCKEGCNYCHFDDHPKALGLAIKYKLVDLKRGDTLNELLKSAAIQQNVQMVKTLLNYSDKYNIPFSAASVVNRAKRVRSADIVNLIEKFARKHPNLDNAREGWAQYH
jgi:hypothetical protein